MPSSCSILTHPTPGDDYYKVGALCEGRGDSEAVDLVSLVYLVDLAYFVL